MSLAVVLVGLIVTLIISYTLMESKHTEREIKVGLDKREEGSSIQEIQGELEE
jgi:hypothetical protein